MRLKKALSIAANVIVLLVVAAWFEGQFRTWGIIGFILFHVILASYRMWTARKTLGIMMESVGAIADKHRLEALDRKQKKGL